MQAMSSDSSVLVLPTSSWVDRLLEYLPLNLINNLTYTFSAYFFVPAVQSVFWKEDRK